MTRLILAFALFLPLRLAEAQNPLDTSIRTVNWDSLLAHDAACFNANKSNFDEYYGQYFEVGHDINYGGYFDPAILPILYGDLNRDGRLDAIVNLCNPGTAESGTGLIFLQTPSGPKYCGCISGSHFLDTIMEDTILFQTAHWLDQDPDCCERAHDIQKIVGDGDTVRFLPLRIEPEPAYAYVTVSYFYAALSDDFGYTMLLPDSMTHQEYAYSMLSKTYQNSHPYKQWLKGYAHTLSVNADVDKNSPDSAVRVKITSVDTINGHTITTHYAGVWYMKFVTNNRPYLAKGVIAGWFLDREDIREVK